jgi:replicative DNA helicase
MFFKEIYNKEAELQILGSFLVDSSLAKTFITKLNIVDFYFPEHQRILNGMFELQKENSPIDLFTLSEKLKLNGGSETFVGINYLCELINFVVTTANIAFHIKILKEYSHKRELNKAIEDAYSTEDFEQKIAILSNKIKEISKETTQKNHAWELNSFLAHDFQEPSADCFCVG